MLNSYICALEGAGWSFATLRTGDFLATAGRAARQLFAIAGRELGHKPPLAIRFAARPFSIRIALRLSSRVVPLDLETFFKVHFTKVGDQTRLGMQRYLELGKRAELPFDAIEQLLGYLA
jgi:2-dehydropantoate 2-reductase